MNGSQFDELPCTDLDMPYLCMKRIFERLSLRDLINCRAVSRQFKFYAEEVGVDELAVNDGKGLFRKGTNWWLTNKPIDSNNSISLKAFKCARSSPFKLHQQLKFLHMDLKYGGLDFKILNDFKQLVHLEVKLGTLENRSSGSLAKPKMLNHPNLRVFKVCVFSFPLYNLGDLPKLESLACNEIKTIRVEHPETIKRLVCGHHGDKNLAKFKNLEILECGSSNGIRLADWKLLKELRVGMLWPCRITAATRFETFKSSVLDIMRQKTVLKREELKLFLGEVLLVDVKQLEDLASLAQLEYIWFKNYKLLRCDSYPSVTKLNFNSLMQLDVELSADFFVRFPAIKYLTASGPVDQNDFEWFLKNAKALSCLTLTNTSLPQSFMNNLPKLVDSRLIENLQVDESSDLVTDFNFILQFEQLKVFETSRQLGSLDLAANAFRRLREFTSFQSRVGDEFVKINRFSRIKNNYTLKFYSISNNKPSTQTFCQHNLRWTELATLYEKRAASP